MSSWPLQGQTISLPPSLFLSLSFPFLLFSSPLSPLFPLSSPLPSPLTRTFARSEGQEFRTSVLRRLLDSSSRIVCVRPVEPGSAFDACIYVVFFFHPSIIIQFHLYLANNSPASIPVCVILFAVFCVPLGDPSDYFRTCHVV